MKFITTNYSIRGRWDLGPSPFDIPYDSRIGACCGSRLVKTPEDFYRSAKGITVFEGDCITGYTGPKKNHTEYQLVELPDGQKLSFAFRTKWSVKKDV